MINSTQWTMMILTVLLLSFPTGGNGFRLPKPSSHGVDFLTLVEQYLSRIRGSDPNQWNPTNKLSPAKILDSMVKRDTR